MTLATELMVMMQNSVTRTARSWRKVTLLNNAEKMVASSNVASGTDRNVKQIYALIDKQ